MIKNARKTRVVALDLRLHRFAFAVFEGAQLLDWGARKYAIDDGRVALIIDRLIGPILSSFAPSVAAIKQMPGHICSQTRYQIALQSFTTEFEKRSIE